MARTKADWVRLLVGASLVLVGLAVVGNRVWEHVQTTSAPDEPAERPYRIEWLDQNMLRMTGTAIGGIPYKLLIHPGDLDHEAAERAARDCHDALRTVDGVMSAYRPETDLSKLNNAAAGQAVVLDEELYDLVKVARDYTARTDGAFDPTARRLFQQWKAAGKAGRLPTADEIDRARQLSGWDRIRLDDSRRTAAKTVDGLQVDLGAIAKGYAVDKAVEALRSAHVAGAMVEVGGEVRVFGTRVDAPDWILAIDHPFQPGEDICGRVHVSDRAVATSGNYHRFTTINGKRHSHIVDPRTGQPANTAASVTVIAADCMTADIWSTALSVLGPEGLARIEAIDGIEAMMVMGSQGDAKVYKTRGFDDYLIDGKVRLNRSADRD